ncbi:hypothetical protein VNO80_20099 [Phaseolus coccineus]|uniref:Uncharacterized protein n=1 Tax=Phaseolus coccineus TaxID=3886 RepID=A0AAN9R1D0_PHACN
MLKVSCGPQCSKLSNTTKNLLMFWLKWKFPRRVWITLRFSVDAPHERIQEHGIKRSYILNYYTEKRI